MFKIQNIRNSKKKKENKRLLIFVLLLIQQNVVKRLLLTALSRTLNTCLAISTIWNKIQDMYTIGLELKFSMYVILSTEEIYQTYLIIHIIIIMIYYTRGYLHTFCFFIWYSKNVNVYNFTFYSYSSSYYKMNKFICILYFIFWESIV